MKIKFNIVLFVSLVGLVFVLTQNIVNSSLFNDDTTSIELNDTDSEEELVENELKFFANLHKADYLSAAISIQLKHNLDFLNSLYSNPFLNRDIKPPHTA